MTRAHHHHDAIVVGPVAIGEDATLDELLAQLRAAGFRLTTARRAVLAELLADRAEHPSVEELTERIQRHLPSIHLSTVYRTLDLLAAVGILVEVHLADGPASYHLASDTHHHALCARCGAVIDLPGQITSGLGRQLADEHGFHLAVTHLTLTGLCDRCYRLARSARPGLDDRQRSR